MTEEQLIEAELSPLFCRLFSRMPRLTTKRRVYSDFEYYHTDRHNAIWSVGPQEKFGYMVESARPITACTLAYVALVFATAEFGPKHDVTLEWRTALAQGIATTKWECPEIADQVIVAFLESTDLDSWLKEDRI